MNEKNVTAADATRLGMPKLAAHRRRLEASIEASLLAGTHECNNCDLPVTTPNPGGYCDECLEETI